jgi:hypothetical protein
LHAGLFRLERCAWIPACAGMTPVLLAACAPEGSNATTAAADDNRIECRIANAPGFERFCPVERRDGEAGRILTVRKPDGGFRRLLVTDDGRGVAAADGAEQPEVTIVADDAIEVAIGGDVFRLPARIRR